MANKTLSMQKIRQVLLFLDRGFSQRSIERETGINRRTIAAYTKRFIESGFNFNELLLFSNDELYSYLRADQPPEEQNDPRRQAFENQLSYFIKELEKTGVTRLLLWEEYIHDHPDGFGYSRFCELLQEHIRTQGVTMHFEHEPGRMLQVDFAGDMLAYVDAESGEVIQCPVFVAVLPFSGYGYVEALPNATLPQVIRALNNCLGHFGGAPLSAKSDNMKQWVTRSNRYEPAFNDMLQQWANHNNIALLASRPAKPKDKPSVENAVKITYQRIYAPLRNMTFNSLRQLNEAIKEKLAVHHGKNFQRRTFSRRELFTEKERYALQALLATPYEVKHYTRAKVQNNYHVVVGEDWHFYSVPFRYVGKEVRIAYCTDTVEIYYGSKRIALHHRSYKKHGYSTDHEHQPEHHRRMRERKLWNPDDYLSRAEKYGLATKEYFKKVMDNKLIIDQSYQACQGLMRLASLYPNRIEAACSRALKGRRFTYMAVKDILDNRMDLLEDGQPQTTYTIPLHHNIRGADEYK